MFSYNVFKVFIWRLTILVMWYSWVTHQWSGSWQIAKNLSMGKTCPQHIRDENSCPGHTKLQKNYLWVRCTTLCLRCKFNYVEIILCTCCKHIFFDGCNVLRFFTFTLKNCIFCRVKQTKQKKKQQKSTPFQLHPLYNFDIYHLI